MASRNAAVAWMRGALSAMSSEPLKSETSAARDLGYTWGRFTESPRTGAALSGYYVRVWTRRADGTWQLAADITAFVKGRKLDDDGNVLLRFKGGAKGVLHSSQISVGEENNLNIRVYGELGGLEWHQKEPNTLLVKWLDQPMQVYRAANGYLCDAAKSAGRTPPAAP